MARIRPYALCNDTEMLSCTLLYRRQKEPRVPDAIGRLVLVLKAERSRGYFGIAEGEIGIVVSLHGYDLKAARGRGKRQNQRWERDDSMGFRPPFLLPRVLSALQSERKHIQTAT